MSDSYSHLVFSLFFKPDEDSHCPKLIVFLLLSLIKILRKPCAFIPLREERMSKSYVIIVADV